MVRGDRRAHKRTFVSSLEVPGLEVRKKTKAGTEEQEKALMPKKQMDKNLSVLILGQSKKAIAEYVSLVRSKGEHL